MDYIQAFKDGHIIVTISTNEEANYLFGLCDKSASLYKDDHYEQFPYVAVKRADFVDGFKFLHGAQAVLRNRCNGAEPIVLSFAEFCAGDPEPDGEYEDINSIL